VEHDISAKAFFTHLTGVKAINTASKYEACVTSFLKLMAANGYQTFEEMPPGLLSEFASMLRQEKKSASTVRVHVYAVKKYLDWVRGKGVPVALQARVDLPKKDLRVREVLAAKRFSEFFRCADQELHEPIRTAVMLLPCCGLRASEMVSIKLGHIQKARVKLQGTRGGKPIYKKTLFLKVRGKGGKERHVPLMEEGTEILTGYLAGWRKRQNGPWLFPRVNQKTRSTGAQHISDRYLRAGLQQMREPMGMDFTPHTFRRTYITTLWRKKIDLATIAKIAGHANVQTTIDHYIAMDPTDSVNALHAAGSSLMED
jgi:site-specific recombinase XerD